jgi:hypothetical protein
MKIIVVGVSLLFVVLLHWVVIIVSLLSCSYFFGVIRLLIFVLHDIATTFDNSKGSNIRTFTYVKHCLIFFAVILQCLCILLFLLKVIVAMPSFLQHQHFHSLL